jgi:uncharacterized cupredoxin-like copper-binding protein
MLRSIIKLALLFSLVVLATLGITACGGGASPNQPVEVKITLTEFNFVASTTSFKVGVPYHFVISNNGTVPHEFDIIQPQSGQMTPEQVQQSALAHINQTDLAAGATATLDYTFSQEYPQGTLELACHLPGHYEAGMKIPIVVTK